MKVICKKASEACIGWCEHAEPHEIIELSTEEPCTSIGECVMPGMDYEDKFKVKCIKLNYNLGAK